MEWNMFQKNLLRKFASEEIVLIKLAHAISYKSHLDDEGATPTSYFRRITECVKMSLLDGERDAQVIVLLLLCHAIEASTCQEKPCTLACVRELFGDEIACRIQWLSEKTFSRTSHRDARVKKVQVYLHLFIAKQHKEGTTKRIKGLISWLTSDLQTRNFLSLVEKKREQRIIKNISLRVQALQSVRTMKV
jgi:hypothetical protein